MHGRIGVVQSRPYPGVGLMDRSRPGRSGNQGRSGRNRWDRGHKGESGFVGEHHHCHPPFLQGRMHRSNLVRSHNGGCAVSIGGVIYDDLGSRSLPAQNGELPGPPFATVE